MKVLLKVLMAITLIALAYGISWVMVVGLIKLITMCFGITFNYGIATGIWLVIVLIKLIFHRDDKSK